ncbi:MAG: phage tail tape measure protein [Prevotella sp.]|nr:phage tail tape measure protein [Prevotella sp.]
MSNINSNATVTLTVNGKQAQDMLDGLKKKSQDLEKAISKAAAAGNKADLKKLQRELKQTNRQIQQIESATVGVEKVMRNLDRATPKELNKTLQTLKKQLNGIERGTVEWQRQCEAIKRVKAEIDKVNMELRESEGRWSRFNRIVNDWQTTIMGAAAAVTGLVMTGRQAVKAYAEMDAEMANVRKFTGMTAEQVEDLNEEFKKMDTRTSREDLNKLAQEAGRLGKQSKEDVMGFVKAADQINVALDDLGEGATLTLSKLTTIFGDEEKLGTEKALLAVGSVINELSQNCTASAPYLAQFAQRLAGVGAQAKMTIPEIMGFGAVLDSQGQAVEMSATALSVLITDLFKKQDQIIKATGLNAEKFKETLQRSTNEGLIMLIERLHELGNIDVLAPVFKEMGENGSRAAGVLAALAGNIDKVKWEQQEANKAFQEATSVTDEFNVQNNTVQAGLDKASKRLKEISVQLGQQLAPVMSHVITGTSLLLRTLSTIITFFVKYKAEIITATAVMAAYTIAVNAATIGTKLATAAHLLWNAAIKTMNVLLPIAQVLMNGLKLAFERIVWQTRGANAAQQAYNKSLVALKANAAAAKTAYALLAVAIVAIAVAITRYIKSQQVEARVQKEVNNLRKEAAARVAEEKSKIDNLVAAAKNEKLSLDERQRAINALNRIIPKYNAQLDATTGKYKANKRALDNYINSLVRMYEVMGAKEKIKEIGRQKAELAIQIEEKKEQIRQTKQENAEEAGRRQGVPQTTMGGYMPGSVNQTASSSASVAGLTMGLHSLENEMKVLDGTLDILKKIYGDELQKQEIAEVEPTFEPEAPIVTGSGGGTGSGSTGGNNNTGTGTQDKFAAEKLWKEEEEALNRIAYATGKKNYEQYTKDMLQIEIDYHELILKHTDLTNKEKLDAEVGYYEAKKKKDEEMVKLSAEQEEESYNKSLALLKQGYADGKLEKEVYDQAIEMLELQHLQKMVSIYKEGSKERLQAERAYQDKLIADMEKRRQETERKEKEHQERLAELKKEYFGDNLQERTAKYNADLESLKELYEIEIKAAGDNAQEKLRIEEAYQKAKKALRHKYGFDELNENKNFLESWTEDVTEWLDSDMGKAVTGSIDVLTSSMSSIFQQLSTLVQAEMDIQTNAINKKYDNEIAKAEGNTYRVKKLEKEKEREIAKIKNEANKKAMSMQVIQAVAQTATAALNAYSSAAAIPIVGYILAPIAAAMAVAAGMMQVAAIKKQQKASEAQGYSEGGFTGQGGRDEVAGVVHKGEWVASQNLVNSPVARPMIDALEYAQRNNTIGSLQLGAVAPQAASPTVIVQQSPAPMDDAMVQVLTMLTQRLNEPFVTVNTVEGDTGIKQAQDEYAKLIRNKTPKSRRK